jgi:hypothetical protein
VGEAAGGMGFRRFQQRAEPHGRLLRGGGLR